ncbi:MAG: sigma-70 family RNA polymerase sigma factor [Oscillospiraceae bacterium]|nr:sigma-70 family RNA polymerase sigma factor [Oscillospiraceae bacterium]MBR4101794.1 sigma-70 family RNA polymerase sigma factor [Oscillospiraceae bacterium]MBR6618615.1 sigma-70 family RNA polymerase sigma factor [Oscillospiraceae bacterium]
MTERELRSLIDGSRKDGFRSLFQHYNGYVYAIVWDHIRSVGTHEDADECLADVFTDVFLHFDKIEEGRLQSYIRTVAKRKAVDCFRRLSAKPPSSSMEDEEEAIQAASDTNVEQDYERTALRQILLDKIRLLGEPDTTIVMMKYFYDCKSDEIARVVHMNHAAVRQRLHRAMKRLQELLSDEGISL